MLTVGGLGGSERLSLPYTLGLEFGILKVEGVRSSMKSATSESPWHPEAQQMKT